MSNPFKSVRFPTAFATGVAVLVSAFSVPYSSIAQAPSNVKRADTGKASKASPFTASYVDSFWYTCLLNPEIRERAITQMGFITHIYVATISIEQAVENGAVVMNRIEARADRGERVVVELNNVGKAKPVQKDVTFESARGLLWEFSTEGSDKDEWQWKGGDLPFGTERTPFADAARFLAITGAALTSDEEKLPIFVPVQLSAKTSPSLYTKWGKTTGDLEIPQAAQQEIFGALNQMGEGPVASLSLVESRKDGQTQEFKLDAGLANKGKLTVVLSLDPNDEGTQVIRERPDIGAVWKALFNPDGTSNFATFDLGVEKSDAALKALENITAGIRQRFLPMAHRYESKLP